MLPIFYTFVASHIRKMRFMWNNSQEDATPDLGRKRSDGFFVGLLRLMISDGYPIARMLDNDEEE